MIKTIDVLTPYKVQNGIAAIKKNPAITEVIQKPHAATPTTFGDYPFGRDKNGQQIH